MNRLLMWQLAGAAGQKPETIGQTNGDLFGRQYSDPRGGQLNRQRDPIDSTADLTDGCSIALAQLQARCSGLCPFHEQIDRLNLGDLLWTNGVRRGYSQRRHLADHFAGYV